MIQFNDLNVKADSVYPRGNMRPNSKWLHKNYFKAHTVCKAGVLETGHGLRFFYRKLLSLQTSAHCWSLSCHCRCSDGSALLKNTVLCLRFAYYWHFLKAELWTMTQSLACKHHVGRRGDVWSGHTMSMSQFTTEFTLSRKK